MEMIALEADLLEMMTQSVVWEKLLRTDSHGKKKLAAPETIVCYYWDKLDSRLNASGDWEVTTGIAYLGGSYPINNADVITIPGGKKPSIFMVEQYNDDVGPYLTVVTFGA